MPTMQVSSRAASRNRDDGNERTRLESDEKRVNLQQVFWSEGVIDGKANQRCHVQMQQVQEDATDLEWSQAGLSQVQKEDGQS